MPETINQEKLEATKKRVELALRACNTVTIKKKDRSGVVSEEKSFTTKYHFDKITHLNSEAQIKLTQAIEDFASDKISEDVMKDAIKALRATSEAANTIEKFSISEPSPEDFARMKTLFNISDGDRVTAIFLNEKARLDFIRAKFKSVFLFYETQFKRRFPNTSQAVLRSDSLARVARQYVKICLDSLKEQCQISSEDRELFKRLKDSEFVFDDNGVKIALEDFNCDEAELEKDIALGEAEIELEAIHTPNGFDVREVIRAEEIISRNYEDEIEIPEPLTKDELKKIVVENVGYIPYGATLFDEDQAIDAPIKGDIVDGTISLSGQAHLPVTTTLFELCEQKNAVGENKADDNFNANGEKTRFRHIEQSVASESENLGAVEIQQSKALPETVKAVEKSASSEKLKDAHDLSWATHEKFWSGGLIELDAMKEEELSEEEKALAAAVEDDGEEVEEDEPIQGGLFGDISAPTIKRKKMFADATMIETAFEWHREEGFPYRVVPPAMAMKELQQLAETEGKALINTKLAYQVADHFHQHRFHAAANGMSSPFASFNDEKKLKKAIRLELKLAGKPRVFAGGMMTLVNGTQACSNFRPGFASYLYREYCPDDATVLDTSTGYGGRLLGAVASQKVSKYIGIDPNVPTFQANVRMIETLKLRSLVEFELYNLPAEDVDAELLRERCDFSFTSPPYFAKEIYSNDETQSWKRYSTGEAWRDKFLKKMLELTFIALKPGSFGIVNIADVKVKNKKYPLADWTRELGVKVGFTYVRTDQFPMMARFGKGMADEIAFEPVIIFKKES